MAAEHRSVFTDNPTTTAKAGPASPPGFEQIPRRLHGGGVLPQHSPTQAASTAGASSSGHWASRASFQMQVDAPMTPPRRCGCGTMHVPGNPYCSKCGGVTTPTRGRSEGPPTMSTTGAPPTRRMQFTPQQRQQHLQALNRAEARHVPLTPSATSPAYGEFTNAASEAPSRRRRFDDVGVDRQGDPITVL